MIQRILTFLLVAVFASSAQAQTAVRVDPNTGALQHPLTLDLSTATSFKLPDETTMLLDSANGISITIDADGNAFRVDASGDEWSSIHFRSDVNEFFTGKHFAAYVDGVLSFEIEPFGTVAAVGSTETLPSYHFIGDTGTGMYRRAANEIGFAANSTWVMSIKPSGVELNIPLAVASGGTGITAYGHRARVRTPGTASHQSIPNSTTTKLTVFTSEIEDANALWNNATSATTVLPAGGYFFLLSVAGDSATWQMAVFDDGALFQNYSSFQGNHPGWSGFIVADGLSVYDFRVTQASGGALNIYDDATFPGVVLMRVW